MNANEHSFHRRGISIAMLVIVAIVLVATIVLAGFAVVSYGYDRTHGLARLRVQVKADGDQLATALALPVWNFDHDQIERVIQSAFVEPTVAAVVLEAESAQKKTTIWTRSEDGVARMTDAPFPTNGLIEEVRTVKTPEEQVLGTVQLFGTSKFVEEDLRQGLLVTIGRIIVVDAVLTVGLYLVLCRWVINPLKDVQRFAVAVTSGSAADRRVRDRRFYGELELLRGSTETMVAQLEQRFAEKEDAERALRRQAAFDELIARLMGQFVSASASEIDAQIIASLKAIAEFVGVDSAVVIQADGNVWSVTHGWAAAAFGNRLAQFQKIPRGGSPFIENRVEADEPVAIRSLAELPPTATAERERWDKAGLKAILHVPLRARGGRINGALTLASFSCAVDWPVADIPRVRILSNAIANTLERKVAEETVLRSREQLRALTAKLQSLREEERTHLSREIHDHLGQLLTALKLDLRSVERKVVALQDSETKTLLNNKIISAQKMADETLVSVQKIASELRPGILDRLGLAAAIQSEAASFESRTGIRCECRIIGEPPAMSHDHSTTAFRIFQELLTNIARHAKAENASVRLSFNVGRMILELRDNGVGINTSDIDNPKSLGILGVQERASLLGGTASFQGKPGEGTTVIVTLPYGRDM